MIQNLINHIVFILDASSSMQTGGKDKELVKFVDSEVAYLATRSKDLGQETRVSVYTFADTVKRLIYDMDVLRLPSLQGHYTAYGNTAMLEGLGVALDDVEKYTPPFADSSALFYLISDGENNRIVNHTVEKIAKRLNSLPENYTVAVFVPDQRAVFEAKRFGIPVGNIAVWNADGKRGVEESAAKVRATTESYMKGRATGVRGSKDIFKTQDVSTQKVVANLELLNPSKYLIINVTKDASIKETYESWEKKTYTIGSGYYQLTKKETIQDYKNVLVKHKKTGKVYHGDAARKIIGLPTHTVDCSPSSGGDYLIFVQSGAPNRKVLANTEMIVLL